MAAVKYQFGDYEVVINKQMGNRVWPVTGGLYYFYTTVRYKSAEIVNSESWADEATGLDWASGVIANHKLKLRKLQEVANGTQVQH